MFRFRCMCCSAACLVDTPAGSVSSAHLHSAMFQDWLASEPRVQALKILQHACCEWVGCRILPFCTVQMLEFTCIFGIAMLAAYTVAPRQSSLGCLPQSVWRYMCALRSTHLQNPLQLQACLHCTGFLQTSLHRSGFCVYSAALCLPHIL